MGDPPELQIVNFALMCGPNNPLVHRAHHILLQLWDGQTKTTSMHKHPLVSHVALMQVPENIVVEEEAKIKMTINNEAMTDYAIQIQCMGSAQGWLDKKNGWNGPEYVREKCWLNSMMTGVFAHELMTDWRSQRQHDLLGLSLPGPNETESQDQQLAREIVHRLVADSWCLKLSHGISAKLFGADTLGMLWRKHEGSDCKDETYAGWLRWAEIACTSQKALEHMEVPAYNPTMIGDMF